MFKKIAYFFCKNAGLDPVALSVYHTCRQLAPFEDTALLFDGQAVSQWNRIDGTCVLLIRTDEVITDRYERYAQAINGSFGDSAFIGVVNWHEGQNAPDRIFTVHSNADVTSGNFGLTDPSCMRSILLSLETARAQLGLCEWRTTIEASHWSGTMTGSAPELIPELHVPVFDVEIGSTALSWGNPLAIRALAVGLLNVRHREESALTSLLCLGGVHFESAFRDAVIETPNRGYAVSHILPNRWMRTDCYSGQEGISTLRQCIGTIRGGIKALVYHESLKAVYRQTIREVACEFGVPIMKHRELRDAQLTLPFAD